VALSRIFDVNRTEEEDEEEEDEEGRESVEF
jgi:hypothetical protein